MLNSLHIIFYPPISSHFPVSFHLSKIIHAPSCFVQAPPFHCYTAHHYHLSSAISPILYFILFFFSPCLYELCPVLHRAATTALRLGHKLPRCMGVLCVCTQDPQIPTCPWEQLSWLKFCTICPFPELLHTLEAGQLSLPPSPPPHQPVTWQFPFLSLCKILP